MSMKLEGLDKLFKKLNNLSHIETEKAIEEVAEDVEKVIKDTAKQFSNTSYLYIGKGKMRKYGTTCFIDVGFHSDNADFDEWKPLWFQNWGYFDKGLNFNGEIYINNHQLWFNGAVENARGDVQRKLKEKIRREIKGALK